MNTFQTDCDFVIQQQYTLERSYCGIVFVHDIPNKGSELHFQLEYISLPNYNTLRECLDWCFKSQVPVKIHFLDQEFSDWSEFDIVPKEASECVSSNCIKILCDRPEVNMNWLDNGF